MTEDKDRKQKKPEIEKKSTARKSGVERKPRRPRAIAIPIISGDAQACCVGGVRLSEAMEDALSDRDHVIMCRVNDPALESIDTLVEAGLCDSRSTAAAFLIREGIKADAELFNRIREVTQKISALKSELRQLIEPVMEDSKEEKSKESKE
jgi:hypothetical protein